MIVRVLFPPDGVQHVDFKDADGYGYDNDRVRIFRYIYDYYGHKDERVLGYFTKENIIGVFNLDEVDEKENKNP